MIKEFADKETKLIWEGYWSKKIPPEIQKKSLAKLGMLNNVKDLTELSVPPGNNLHSLKGLRKGQHAIGSTTNGEFASLSLMGMHSRLKLQIIIKIRGFYEK